MIKGKKLKPVQKSRQNFNKPAAVELPISKRDASFWKSLEDYNQLDARQRAERLKSMGMIVSDDDVLRILTKSHFVIPGKTRYACQNCGECCRYVKKVAQFTYESCAFLNDKNRCSKHENRYLVCRWFPFWVYRDPQYGALLTIKPYCGGYGQGDLVNYDQTLASILDLSARSAMQDDGAFVIHELLLLPGSREWVFPSRQNVDRLLMLIAKNEETPVNHLPSTSEPARDLNYAHFYTSGLLGSISDPHLTVNETGSITDANEAFCMLCGEERSTLAGKKLASLFADGEAVSGDIQTCFYRGKVTAVPHKMTLKNGSTLPVLFDSMAYRDRSDGLVHGILICLKEISPIVYNELAQSKNYVRGLIEASLDAFMVINRDGTLMDVNQAFVNISGTSREQLVGSRFDLFFTHPEKAQSGVAITFRDGQVRNFELDLKTAGDEVIPVSFNATVFHNHDGIIQGIFAAARDIRETRRIMKQLDDSKNYARGLIESSVDLMVTVDHGGMVTDVNHAATTLSEYSREALIGSTFKNYFDNPELAQESIQTVFNEGRLIMCELMLVSKSKKRIPVSFNASVYCDSDGRVQGVLAVARDIRERLIMIKQLEDAKNYARELIESSIDLMVTVNQDGRITDVNGCAVELTGVSRAELVNSCFEAYFTDSKRARMGIQSAFREGKVRDYQLELLNKNNEKIPVSFNASIYHDNEGNIAGVFAIARDMRTR